MLSLRPQTALDGKSPRELAPDTVLMELARVIGAALGNALKHRQALRMANEKRMREKELLTYRMLHKENGNLTSDGSTQEDDLAGQDDASKHSRDGIGSSDDTTT